MSRASQYDPAHSSYYMGRASRLLRQDWEADKFCLGYGQYQRLERDGEWVRLGRVNNVGAKFLRWLVENNFLERRGRGLAVESFINDWYRLKTGSDAGIYLDEDFGDLWVPG